jgi:DNA-binding NarL/FixJ family response regulator
VRLVLGSDQRLCMDVLAAALSQQGVTVAALARSPQEVLTQVARYNPDVCLLSARCSASSGIDIPRLIRANRLAVKVVILSDGSDSSLQAAASGIGAAAYVSRSHDVTDLIAILQRVRAGERPAVLSPAVPAVRSVRPAFGPESDPRLGLLTVREREVLTLMIEGRATKEIAQSLAITVHTVRTHAQSVLTKLGAHSRLEASRMVARRERSMPPDWRSRMTTTRLQPHAELAVHARPQSSRRRLLVLDGHVTFADALATRLGAEPGMSAYSATTIEQARRALLERRFDGLLVDLDLDGHSGLRFAVDALTEQPDLRIVVVTAAKDERHVVDAVQIGVTGWVSKDEPIERLLAVIRGALRGETWIPPRLLTGVLVKLQSAQREMSEHDMLLAKLTQREREILSLLAAGLKADAIASQLYLARGTVRSHIQHLMAKLNVHSAVAAVAVARRAARYAPPRPRLDADRTCAEDAAAG